MNKGLRGIIKQGKEDKRYLEGIGDIYEGDKVLLMLKKLEKEISTTIKKICERDHNDRTPYEWGYLYAYLNILGPEADK